MTVGIRGNKASDLTARFQVFKDLEMPTPKTKKQIDVRGGDLIV